MNDEYIASYSSPSNTDLVHWKYIKKYKGKNNKWVYIYEKAKNNVKNIVGLTAKEEMNEANKDAELAEIQENNAKYKYENANEELKRAAVERNSSAYSTIAKSNEYVKETTQAKSDREAASKWGKAAESGSYEMGKGVKLKTSKETAKKIAIDYASDAIASEQRAKIAKNQIDVNRKSYKNAQNKVRMLTVKRNGTNNVLSAAKINTKNKKQKALNSINKYYSTPLGKLEKVSKKGKDFINKLLGK